MLAMSRRNNARAPLATMSMFSAMLAPLNSSVSVPAWPSTTSLPSPGFQMNVSLPAPSSATSSPRPPVTMSLPSPPRIVSLPWLPMMVSLPAPASMVRPMTPAGRPAALIVSLPLPALMVRRSPASVPVILTCALRPVTATLVPGADDIDLVAAVGAIDDHLVGRDVARPDPSRRG